MTSKYYATNLLAIFILSLTVILTGCTTTNDVEIRRAELEFIAKQNERLNQPLFKMQGFTCTLTNPEDCTVEVSNPNQKTVQLPKDTNGWDFANQLLRTATAVSPWLVVGEIAKEGIRSAGNNTSISDSYNAGDTITSGDVQGDTITTTSGDTQGDTVTSGDVQGDTSGDTISDSYNAGDTSQDTTTTTTTTEENSTNTTDTQDTDTTNNYNQPLGQ